MDPNATLDRIRVLTADLIDFALDEPEPTPPTCTVPTHIVELADLVDALDAWLTYGGLKPAAWSPPASSLA